jgi:hypothetical protein
VVAALALAVFTTRVAIRPHGEWDAWAIWNLRARALLRGAPAWPVIFSPDIAWSHPDYPLLIPLSVARLWAYGGRESTLVPQLVAGTFFGASIATVVVSIGELRGWIAGFLSGGVLLVSRSFLLHSTYQFADAPLAFFVMVAIAMVAVGRQVQAETTRYFVIGGLAAGLGAWTKNEGSPLLAITAVLVMGIPLSSNSRRLRAFALGAAIPLISLAFFKLHLAQSSNYMFEPQAIAGIQDRLADGARWSIVIGSVLSMLVQWGEIPWGALAIALAVVGLTGRIDRAAGWRAITALSAVVALMTAYVFAYVITPLPLEEQISSSLSRLVTQVWPAIVWTLFQMSGGQMGSERGVAPALQTAVR